MGRESVRTATGPDRQALTSDDARARCAATAILCSSCDSRSSEFEPEPPKSPGRPLAGAEHVLGTDCPFAAQVAQNYPHRSPDELRHSARPCAPPFIK
jgi:hypothetical protein